jgi:hypothetical protein
MNLSSYFCSFPEDSSRAKIERTYLECKLEQKHRRTFKGILKLLLVLQQQHLANWGKMIILDS